MPKSTRLLYNHNTWVAVARQLNISTNPSGRSFYSYATSHVSLDPVVPLEDSKNESYMMDASMDIDEDHVVNDHNEDIEQVIEVMPGVHIVSNQKAKRYENSVSDLIQFLAVTHLAFYRMYLWRLGLNTETTILTNACDWRVMGFFTALALGVQQQCHDTVVKTVQWGLFGARPAWLKGIASPRCTMWRYSACSFSRDMLWSCFQMWNGSFFECTTLKDLGLRIQLGHAYGHSCPTRLPANATFRVIHSNGIHHVTIDQCWCYGLPLSKQLLRIGWWPATLLDPRTAATFEVLQHYHLLNL